MIISTSALMLATLFASAALYISLVEHPARLSLEDACALAQWQPSYKRALPLQAGLAVLGSVVGLIAWFETEAWQWLVGSLVLLANWPFTLLVILPTNTQLMAMQPADAGGESRKLLLRWGKLHDVRSVLGSLAAALFATAIVGG